MFHLYNILILSSCCNQIVEFCLSEKNIVTLKEALLDEAINRSKGFTIDEKIEVGENRLFMR
jgi:hypothetical protein